MDNVTYGRGIHVFWFKTMLFVISISSNDYRLFDFLLLQKAYNRPLRFSSFEYIYHFSFELCHHIFLDLPKSVNKSIINLRFARTFFSYFFSSIIEVMKIFYVKHIDFCWKLYYIARLTCVYAFYCTICIIISKQFLLLKSVTRVWIEN